MSGRVRLRAFLVGAAAVSVALVALVAPHASGDPDGLERVALDEGFAAEERPHPLEGAPTAGYEVDGLGDGWDARVAGLVGVAVTSLGAVGLLTLLRRRAAPAGDAGGPRRASG